MKKYFKKLLKKESKKKEKPNPKAESLVADSIRRNSTSMLTSKLIDEEGKKMKDKDTYDIKNTLGKILLIINKLEKIDNQDALFTIKSNYSLLNKSITKPSGGSSTKLSPQAKKIFFKRINEALQTILDDYDDDEVLPETKKEIKSIITENENIIKSISSASLKNK